MRILFDQGTPAPLRHRLVGHEIRTAFEMGWSELGNGELLTAAEAEFDLLVTTDQNLSYQQNLVGRRIGILVLPTTSWPRIERCATVVVSAVNDMRPGSYLELAFPDEA